jgi:enoyl-[acyl-carrier protein] reductase II
MALITGLMAELGMTAPVIQAGMGLVARPPLVAAVSNAGGLGVLGAANSNTATLRREIAEVRALTDRPFGVDLIFPSALTSNLVDFVAKAQDHIADLDEAGSEAIKEVLYVLEPGHIEDQVQVCIEEAVPVLVSALGTPAAWIDALHGAQIRVFSLAGTLSQARQLADGGVDAVIAAGSEGGGHTGAVGSLSLWNACVRSLEVPVIAGGGVVDGRTLAAALVMGCQAAWVGTRFVASEEGLAHENAKRRILEAAPEDCVITRAYSGKTMRVVRNDFVRSFEGREHDIAPFPLQLTAAGGRSVRGLRGGDVAQGAVPAGQGVGAIDSVLPAAQIIEQMVREATAVLADSAVTSAQRA